MNKLKEKYYIALGNLQNMAIDNTKGSKSVDICVSDINQYVAYLQSKIDKFDERVETYKNERDTYKRLAETYVKKYNKAIEEYNYDVYELGI